MSKMARIAWVAAFLAASGAHAGPLEDALARLEKNMQAQQERMARLEAQVENKGVIGLYNELEDRKSVV